MSNSTTAGFLNRTFKLILEISILRSIYAGCSKVIIERARLQHLSWGNSGHIGKLRKAHPAGFDLIIGADIVYAEEFVTELFRTAHALLKDSAQVRRI